MPRGLREVTASEEPVNALLVRITKNKSGIRYWNMDADIHIYVDVQSLRTSSEESYSSVESRCGEIQMRRNTVRKET